MGCVGGRWWWCERWWEEWVGRWWEEEEGGGGGEESSSSSCFFIIGFQIRRRALVNQFCGRGRWVGERLVGVWRRRELWVNLGGWVGGWRRRLFE